jgi:5-methylthioadenosine/S-adenosylhomocysteine deaminase
MDAEIGSLEPGKRANIITVDLRKPHISPADMPIWRPVCFGNGQDVDTVLVHGTLLMRNRKALQVDVAEVLAGAQAETSAMLDRTGFRNLLEEPATLWGRTRH